MAQNSDKGPVIFYGGGGGGSVVSRGAIRKFSSLKGEAFPKVEGGRGFFTGKCTGLIGHSRENRRGESCKIFLR